MEKTDEVKLGGAKRKNGHKLNCSCHICENMKNKAHRGGYSQEERYKQELMNGGSKKKNGHRSDCKCPICKNMKRAKKGGNDEEQEDIEEEYIDVDGENLNIEDDKIDDIKGGRRKKKSNGHKSTCKCPICKNMRKGKKGGDNEIEAEDEEYDYLESNTVGGTRKRRKRGGKRKSRKHRSRRRH